MSRPTLADKARVLWWLILVVVASAFLRSRLIELRNGSASPFDVALLIILAALLLAPLFSEVKIFGVSLKREMQKLRTDVKAELVSIRSEVQQVVSVQNTFNPQVVLPNPAPDAVLRAMEEKLDAILARDLPSPTVRTPPSPPIGVLPDPVLFMLRFELERELRRIVESRDLTTFGPRVVGGTAYVALLQRAELVTAEIAAAVRETYAICSRAIHAQEVSDAQRSFALDAGPKLIEALRQIDRAP